MKMKKSDLGLLIALLTLVIAGASYYFLYIKLNEKTAQIQSENAVLQQEVNRLQELADNKQQYIDDTEAMKIEIEEIKAQFPAKYLEEDEVLYVVGIEKDYDVFAKGISMGRSTVVEVPKPQSEEAPIEAAPEGEEGTDGAEQVAPQEVAPEIMLYQQPVNVEVVTAYNSIKDVIKKINTDPNRKSIETLTLAFDTETGDLTGNLAFTMYTLTGTDAEYVTPKVDGVTYGTRNIFNSADKAAAIEAEKAAEEAAESEE